MLGFKEIIEEEMKSVLRVCLGCDISFTQCGHLDHYWLFVLSVCTLSFFFVYLSASLISPLRGG